jgi:hypothetical protein
VLPVLTYPMVGEVLKSCVIVDMIRFSSDLIALLSPAILYVVSKLPILDELPERVYEFVPSLIIYGSIRVQLSLEVLPSPF